MNALARLAPALLVFACTSGPASAPGMIDTSADGATSVRRLVEIVLTTTESYLDPGDLAARDELGNPTGLDDAQRLAQAGRVRALVQQEAVSGAVLEPELGPVLDWHDAYVRGDATLNPFEVRVAIRASSQLRAILEAATGGPSP